MSDRVKIIEHKGQRIVFADLSNLDEERILDTQREFTRAAIGNKIPLVILDITNTTTTAAVKSESDNAVAGIKKTCGFVYTAIIGVKGLQKIIANAISKDIYFASNLEDAKDHIVLKSPGKK